MKKKWDEYEMEKGDEKGPNLGRSDGWKGHFEEVDLAKCQLCAIVVSAHDTIRFTTREGSTSRMP